MKANNMYHYTACGLDNIYLRNGFVIKETPSGTTVSIHNLDGLHKAIANNIITKDSPINGKEFKFLRIEMDLSQSAIGALMEKSDQTIAKWEKGEIPVPRLADTAIRNLYSESAEKGPIQGLLTKLKDLDRKYHETMIQLEEAEGGWHIADAA